MKKVYWVLLGILSCGTAAQAEVFRWVDANGRVVFSDQAPAGSKASKLNLPGIRPAPPVAAPVASAPSAASQTGQDINAINARINDSNKKIKQENCNTAKQQLSSLERVAQSVKKPEPSMADSLLAAKENVRIWCAP